MAREVIERGLVLVNGEVDTRRGRQVRPGDVVTFEAETLHVVAEALTPGPASAALGASDRVEHDGLGLPVDGQPAHRVDRAAERVALEHDVLRRAVVTEIRTVTTAPRHGQSSSDPTVTLARSRPWSMGATPSAGTDVAVTGR